jgi:DNA replication protein DnaC
LQLPKADGGYAALLTKFAKKKVLVIDDFGLSPLTDEQRWDLLEVIEDRYDKHSTIVTSQLPLEHWHQMIGDPTIADAILDRLVHNAHHLNLSGESRRKLKQK